MPSTDTIITAIGTVKPHVRPVVDEVCNRFGPVYYVWGYADKEGEHGKGLALDFGIKDKGDGPKSTWVRNPGRERHQLGEDIADYLWRHRARLNVWYVIWNRRIISITYPNDGWRPYSGASAHTDHVHVSFESTGTYKPPPAPKPDPDKTLATVQSRLADLLELVKAARHG